MWRLVLVVSLLCCSSEASVSCRDENGAEVDWFILYKTPKKTTGNLKLTGLEYVYIHPDNNNRAKSQRSTKFINAADGLLANTLQPLNLPPPNFGFISYNDGVPEGCSAKVSDPTDTSGGSVSSFGHSKGVVMVEKNQKGVWLLHSTPQFPYFNDPTTFWPTSGARNAQIFICVTFNYDQFKAIGEHLQKIRAFPFRHHIPSDFHRELRDVTAMNTEEHDTKKKKKLSPPTFQQLTSSRGKTFYSIAKLVSDQPEVGDLYVSISNAVRSDVNVQSWGCQPERDGSYCPTRGYKVQNIVLVETGWAKWDPGSDHSKWCVAVDQNKPWTCIADVNRSESQYGRLGGALCVEDAYIRDIFRSFAVYKEEC